MSKLAILGASGHGNVVADTALQIGWDNIVFFDDDWPKLKRTRSYPVCGNTSVLLESTEFSGVIVAIGNNRVRLEKTLELSKANTPIATLIHPRAYVATGIEILAGTVVFAGAVVQPDCKLGMAVIVNTGATVDHDCKIAEGAHISPGAHLAGGVSVGECTWVGIGASINQNLSVGSDVMIGAGAAVVTAVGEGVTVVGVPARKQCS